MASFRATDVLLDIEKLETMLSNGSSSNSTCDSPPTSSSEQRLTTMNTRFTGSSKIYLRNLNKLLNDIEEKQKMLTNNSSSILKRLQPTNSSTRPLTFTSLFARPSIKMISTHRFEPKTISFAQLMTQNSTFSNPQSQYGCARLNEKMWILHCREQLIKAVQEHSEQSLQNNPDEDDFDWNEICSTHLENKWSADVCRNAWKQICNPRINQSKWTTKEERRLIGIVEREPLSADRWPLIAKELGTDRSAYLCAKRYMQIINENYSKRPLDLNEKQQIIDTIRDDHQGHYTKYNQLAYQLGDRTREFIYNQWLHIDPSCKRGRWSPDEHAQLFQHFDQQRHQISNWQLISAPIRTRSSRQCRERVLDTLKNGNRTSKEKHRLFTADEDRLLLEQHAVHGPKWSLIAKEFPQRTDNSLLVRYRMLIKARTQWNWFCQISWPMKTFLLFLYENGNVDGDALLNYLSNAQRPIPKSDQELYQDLEQFGFYRRGLPFPLTDEEFQWFSAKPHLIEHIAQIVLNEFQHQRLCCRKFKAEVKSWFTSSLISTLSDDQIRQMLVRTIPNRRKRPSILPGLATKRTKIDHQPDCKEEPRLPPLPSILSSTSRHILRPVANQFFTSQSTSKLSVNNSNAHFCPYLILIRQNS